MKLAFYTKRFDRRVLIDDVTVGAINPMLTKAGKWAFLPNYNEHGYALTDLPEVLRSPIYFNTIGEIKSYIRRQLFK